MIREGYPHFRPPALPHGPINWDLVRVSVALAHGGDAHRVVVPEQLEQLGLLLGWGWLSARGRDRDKASEGAHQAGGFAGRGILLHNTWAVGRHFEIAGDLISLQPQRVEHRVRARGE